MSERHIFICGFSRAGTTLFYNMLRNSVENFEFMDKEVSAANVLGQSGSMITKRPLDCLIVDQILRNNGRKKQIDAIFCVRDPRSLMTSVHKGAPGDYFQGFESQYFVLNDGKTAKKINPGMNQIMQSYLRMKKNVFLLRYEDLLGDPDGVQKRLEDTLKIEFKSKLGDFGEGSDVPEELMAPLNGVRGIDKSRIEAWKGHPQRIWEQFTLYPDLFDMLKELDYEKDNNWFQEMFWHRLPPA